jgi:REP element-mobilizing transposase RayT
MQKTKPKTRMSRFKQYDYSRGAVLFITFGLKKRLPLMGVVAERKTILNSVGEAVLETIQREMKRNPDITLHRFAIMPDHLHLRLYIRPGASAPLREIGMFVNNLKRWSRWKADKMGVDLDWNEGYHDRICLSAEIIDLVDKYIDNNPLKWSLMHGDNALMRVVEPLGSPIFPLDEWWAGVGNEELLKGRLAAMKLSRSIPRSEIGSVVGRCLAATAKGFIPISTFISPAERELFNALVKGHLPMIRVVPDQLATVYRPKGDEPPLFADGNYLLLARVAAPGISRSDAWHGVNDAIAKASLLGGGEAVYVVDKGKGVEWRFGSRARP